MLERKFESLWSDVHNLVVAANPDDISMIPTTRGLEAIVDFKHKTQVARYRWWAVVAGGNHVYATAQIADKRVTLQRYITHLENPTVPISNIKQVSFANKVSLDCRSANLVNRVGRQAAMRNRLPKRNTTSKFKGVHKAVQNNTVKWRSQIKWDLGSMSMGTYDDEITAARMYDAAAFYLFDGAALYNFPNEKPSIEARQHARDRIQRFRLVKERTAKKI